MQILNLIEDTKGRSDLINAHGLSFYIETKMHKIILDLGPSEKTIYNAKTLGVDLSGVDIVILSHGHYDHSGGIIPFTNKRLLVKEGSTFKQDAFNHEHFLVVHQDGKSYLMSGCAHNGMLNIIEEYIDRYGKAPDVVISGFHLAKKKEYSEIEVEQIRALAKELKKYPTRFVTCHCTGIKAFELMKEIMGDKLEYVHTGNEITMSHFTF